MKELTGVAANFSLMIDSTGERKPVPTLELIIIYQEPTLAYVMNKGKLESSKRFECSNCRVILNGHGLKNLIKSLTEYSEMLDKVKAE